MTKFEKRYDRILKESIKKNIDIKDYINSLNIDIEDKKDLLFASLTIEEQLDEITSW